jgi:hypothetical protein
MKGVVLMFQYRMYDELPPEYVVKQILGLYEIIFQTSSSPIVERWKKLKMY